MGKFADVWEGNPDTDKVWAKSVATDYFEAAHDGRAAVVRVIQAKAEIPAMLRRLHEAAQDFGLVNHYRDVAAEVPDELDVDDAAIPVGDYYDEAMDNLIREMQGSLAEIIRLEEIVRGHAIDL